MDFSLCSVEQNPYLLTAGVYLHALSVPDSPNCVTVPRKSVLSAAGMVKLLILWDVSECKDVEDAADSCNLLYFIGTSSLQHCDPAKGIAPYNAENEFFNIKSGYVTGHNILLHDLKNKC